MGIALASTLAMVLMTAVVSAAAAGTAAPRTTTSGAEGATVERVGTTDVRKMSAQAPAFAGGLRTPHETRPEKEKGSSTAQSGSLAKPSPANRVLVTNENHRGWEGLDLADQRLAGGGNQFTLEPPDQGLCVGGVSPNGPGTGPEVVESVNDALTFYDGTTHQFTAPITISQFYGLPPTIDRTTGRFGPFESDPKCYFDAGSQRWFHTILVIGLNPTTGAFQAPSFLYFAVSTSAEALGTYNIYRINTTDRRHPNCPCFGDQPLLGTDKYGFYVSTAEYPVAGTGFNGPQIYAMSKAVLAAGAMPRVVHLTGITHVVGGRTTGTVQPAISADSQYATANNGTEFFLSGFDCLPTDSCPVAAGQFNKITVWALTNTQSLNTSSPSLHLSLKDLTSEVYGSPVPQQQKPGFRPLGASIGAPLAKVNANDSRMNQVVYARGLLWSGINTVVAPGPRDGIAYFIVNPSVSANQVTASIHRQGYVAVANAYLSFPSVGVNAAGRGVIAMSLMGPNNYPSAAQIAIDEDGVSGPVEIVRTGFRPEDGFTCYPALGGGLCRWGDYSASVAAPDGTIYSATEFIGDNSRTFNANWSTFIWPQTR